MFQFTFRAEETIETRDSFIRILEKIRSGDENLKEQFIKDNIPYITKVVSNLMGTYIDDKNSEEYSIGLTAFNEAIDKYDAKRNGDFFKYSNMVIKHRIIDCIRKNKRHKAVVPLSSIEENYNLNHKLSMLNPQHQLEKIEVKEELLCFERSLKDFEISIGDLVSSSPKHKDSRILSIKIARIIAENEELFIKMIRKKCIPLTDLLEKIKVNRKTIVRNRKFIIAVSLILRSNLDDLKAMVTYTERRGQYE